MPDRRRGWLAALVLLLAATPAWAETTPVHGTADIVLRSAVPFDAAGTPNPFTEVDVAAEVTSPGGRVIRVDGFFDGDGEGGGRGSVFKVRVHADEPGAWTWRSVSNRPDLDGRRGSFRVEGRLAGAFGAGPLVVDPASPRFFAHRDGGPAFLIGKFLDIRAPEPFRFSHTLFADTLTEELRAAMVERHRRAGYNRISVYLANRGDYGGVATTPWLGDKQRNDKTRFDLARWHLYERWVRHLLAQGMAAQLWFFADDSGFGRLPEEDRRRLLRYGMARLSGFANTLFVLALEWQEGWSRAAIERDGRYLQSRNPWKRLVSVHGVPGVFPFTDADWVDFVALQAGNDVEHRVVHRLGLVHRNGPAKPVVQEEHGLGEEDGRNRRNAWAALMSGAAGIGSGAGLEHLAAFVRAVPFERLAPAPERVRGPAHLLTDGNGLSVLYLYGPGQVRVAIGDGTPQPAVWFDPRRGRWHPAPPVAGGGQALRAPDGEDWVLVLGKAAPPVSGPAHGSGNGGTSPTNPSAGGPRG
ncbi:MAG TPA: DUF5060 domain-containing protein [Azospirillum sp.]|nr:DUF5060 domain-containing protein [Azospirillum sp.]